MGKAPQDGIRLIAGLGVYGDARAGEAVKHRSRVAADPTQLHLRQVHLIHAELNAGLRAAGFSVRPSALGENITTRDIALLSLPTDPCLHLGPEAIIEVTRLRNSGAELDRFQPGLMATVLSREAHGHLVHKAGIMGLVVRGGTVKPLDQVYPELPPPPHLPLDRV